MSLRDGATQRVQLVEQQLVVLDGHDNGGGRARVVGQVLLVAEGAKDGVILVAGDVEVMKALPA